MKTLEQPPKIESVLLSNLQYLLSIRPEFMTSDMPQKLADQEDSGSNQYLSENPLLAHIEHYENGVINIFNLTEFDLQIGGVSLDGALIDSRFLGFEIPPLNRRTLEPVSLRTAAFGRLDDRVSVFFYSSAGESESTNKFSLLSRSQLTFKRDYLFSRRSAHDYQTGGNHNL